MAEYILSGGVTSDGIALSYRDSMTVVDGGTANNTTVNSGGYLHVSSGGTANSTIINSGGWLSINDGGTVNDTTVNSNGAVLVEFGGTANNTIVNSSGWLNIYDNAMANDTTVNGGVLVDCGGTANNTIVNSGGILYVSSGAKLTGQTTIAEGAIVSASNDSILDFDISAIDPGSAARFNNLSRVEGWDSNANFTLTASDVQTSGTYALADGASGFNRTITVQNTAGDVLGTLGAGRNFRTNNGVGYFLSVSDSTLNLIIVEGMLLPVSGLVIANQTVSIQDGEWYSSTTVNSSGKLYVSSGGVANNTTVNSSGFLHISSGGVADVTTVNTGGEIYVSSGGTADGTTVSSGGNFYVSSGGVADSTTVEYNGSMHVSSGGVANSTTVNTGGYLYITNGGIANGITLSGLASFIYGNCIISSGGTANNATVNAGGWFHIYDGGTANNTTLNTIGALTLYSGGTANGTTLYSKSYFFISSGATVNNTTVNSGASFTVGAGVEANNTTVNESGTMEVNDNGVANSITICSGATLNLYNNGTANNTILNSGRMEVYDSGTVNSTTVNSGGQLSLHGTATSTTVNSGGAFSVNGGGTANNTTIHSSGQMYVDGTANSTTIDAGGSLYISSGGKLTGQTTIAEGAIVSACQDSILDFDISAIDPGSAALFNDLSLVEGWDSNANLTLTVSGTQANGTYVLADGAAGFNRTITVRNTAGEVLGTLGVGGDPLTDIGASYWLTVSDSILSLTVEGKPLPISDQVIEDQTVSIQDGVVYSNTTVNGGGQLLVSSGGVANNTVINSGGNLYVSSCGVANNTTISSGGYMYVSSGGTASSITVYLAGRVYITTGGTADAIIENGGYVEVSDGAKVTFASNTLNGLTLYSYQDMTVHSGTTANHITINRSYLYIFDGGVVNSTTVYNYGYLHISSGGIANSTTVSNAQLHISSGGVANSTTVYNYGYLHISSGGTANDTYVNSGCLCVFSGGTANTITLDGPYASLYVSSGGMADNITLSNGSLEICSGGTATNIVWAPCEGGDFWIESGASVTFASQYSGVYYSSAGQLLSSAATIESMTFSGYEVCVMSGGVANSTTMNSGRLRVLENGTANNTTISGGIVSVYAGGTASNTAINGTDYNYGGLVVCGTANNNTVNSGGSFYVAGVANNNTVNSGGRFYVDGRGSVNSTTITGGDFCIFSGGTATRTTVAGSGNMELYGVANSTTVNYGGVLKVSSGGTANNTAVKTNGNMHVSGGGTANSTTLDFGSMFVGNWEGGSADGITIGSGGYLYVSSGGTATNVKWTPFVGELQVEEGGVLSFDSNCSGVYYGSGNRLLSSNAQTMSGVTLDSNYKMFVMSGGTANRTSVSYNGELTIYSGGTATSTTLNEGRLFVSSGGTATNTIDSGHVCVYSGGTAINTTVFHYYGMLAVSRGGIANSTTLSSGGSFGIWSGGMANNNTVNSGCSMRIMDGGTANSTTVKGSGRLFVSSGGTAANTRIDSGGSLALNGTLTGKTVIAKGGIINVQGEAELNFNISDCAPGINDILVNDLSAFHGVTFTITVSDYQWNGTYQLAKGASGFNNNNNQVFVKTVAGEIVGFTSPGEPLTVNGVQYALKVASDTLSVTVSGGQDIPDIPVSADIVELTNQAVTLTAEFSADAVKREYSLDGTTWNAYTKPVSVTKNSPVYFAGRDESGFIIEMASYEVKNIDNSPPSIPGTLVSTVNGHSVDLSWTAAYDTGSPASGVVQYEYRISTSSSYTEINASGTTETCAATVDGLKYGTYYWSVRAVDAVGNVGTWCKNKSFSTVDEVAPGVPSNLVYRIENQSTLSVSWDAAVDDSLGSGVSKYEIEIADDEAFGSIVKSVSTTTTAASIGSLSMGDYYFRVCAVDLAGNKSGWTAAETFSIDTDTIPPTISGIRADITGPTNGDVTVTAVFADNCDLGSSLYKIGQDGEWTDYKDGVTVTENAVVFFRAVDTTGNETEASFEVKNIDKTKPVITLIGDTQTPVRQARLMATTDDGSAIFYRINDSGEWTAYTGSIKVLTNASYSFKSTDQAGNTGTAEITFGNIDNEPPVLTLTADTVTLSNSVTLTAETNEECVISYRTGNQEWITYESPLEVKANGVYYFKATDSAGNVANSEITFANLDTVAPTAPTGLRSFVDGRDVALLWNGSTDDNSGIREYVVTYTLEGREFTARTDVSQYVLDNADYGTWSWSVHAVDVAGNESAITAGDDFTVTDSIIPGPQPGPEGGSAAKGDVDGNGISDVMFQWTGGDHQIGFWMNGKSDWQSQGRSRSEEWTILGSHDMNSDGKADMLMAGKATLVDMTGTYIGYYADSVDIDANWHTVGFLVNTNDWVNAVGNLTGTAGRNSIVWYAPELYALGAWTDGTDSWTTISNSFGGSDWALVGCGDFDGDGKDSVVMSGLGGQYFYTADIDGTLNSMGSANWFGWEVRAIGDFAGDGKDDLVLFHAETGSLVMLADGNLDAFASIGQLDISDWFLVGAGDYDGDQKDDLLVRQQSTGMLGYYASGDMGQWNTLGYGVDMSWTVIA